jgi:hypothetical protein
LHIKRYRGCGADEEAKALGLLRDAGIPTITLVGWGTSRMGAASSLPKISRGMKRRTSWSNAGLPFADIIESTADIAAKLHAAGPASSRPLSVPLLREGG